MPLLQGMPEEQTDHVEELRTLLQELAAVPVPGNSIVTLCIEKQLLDQSTWFQILMDRIAIVGDESCNDRPPEVSYLEAYVTMMESVGRLVLISSLPDEELFVHDEENEVQGRIRILLQRSVAFSL